MVTNYITEDVTLSQQTNAPKFCQATSHIKVEFKKNSISILMTEAKQVYKTLTVSPPDHQRFQYINNTVKCVVLITMT
jgi:hypothetical protein